MSVFFIPSSARISAPSTSILIISTFVIFGNPKIIKGCRFTCTEVFNSSELIRELWPLFSLDKYKLVKPFFRQWPVQKKRIFILLRLIFLESNLKKLGSGSEAQLSQALREAERRWRVISQIAPISPIAIQGFILERKSSDSYLS